ncbi:hypothetical protein PWT90_09274 [Aphanocladium album]|nr:hypothetical protein PWT90_09274 [Aphanocladium album]
MASKVADRAFWPPIAAIFDFTLKFEEYIFTITPSTIAIVTFSCMLFHYMRRRTLVRNGLILWLKLLSAVILVAIEISSLATRSTESEFLTTASIPAASLDLVASVALAAFIFVEHRHALRESAFLGLYLSITFLLDIAKCRSYFRRTGLEALGGLAAAAAIIRLTIIILEELPRTALIVDDEIRQLTGREAAAGFWTRSLFLWLNPLIWKGYRGTIAIEDISEIGAEFSSRTLFEQFHPRWLTRDKLATLCLARALLSQMWMYLLWCFIARLAFTGCSFALPFILLRLTDVISANDRASGDVEDSLIGATILALVGIGLSRGAFQQLNNRLTARVRGVLVTEMLDKCHRISQSEAKKSAAMTLMSTDMESIAADIGALYRIPISILEVGLSTYFLSFFVGQGCFVVLFPLAFSTLFGLYIGSKSGGALSAWNGKIQARVAETSKVISQLRVIKMLGLGPTAASYLQHLRQIDIEYSKKYRIFTAILMGAAILTALLPQLLIVAVGLFWTSFDGSAPFETLPAERIFPCLSIVALSQNPLSDLLKAYASLSQLFACLERVQTYLCLPESEDPRTKGLPNGIDEEVPPSNEKKAESGEYAIRFSNASIAPHGAEEPVLRKIDLSIPKSTITATVGASGSGKSTLLQSLLGEATLCSGSICVEEKIIGYADQTAWIQNISIRENIIGKLPFDQQRYNTVVRACLLEEDFAHLPEGDGYLAGSNGMGLSGGQKHRIAAARAAYCGAKLVVLDDIFSALDRKTAVAVLSRLCGENGIFRKAGTTVVLSTYLPECLDIVDQVLFIDGEGGVALEDNSHSASLRSKIEELDSHVSGPAEKAETQSTATKRPKEMSDSELELLNSRRRQDMSLYALFINSVGKRYFWPWILVVICVPLGESMTGLLLLMNRFAGVYMRVWVANAASNPLYYIGYAGIALGGSVASVCSFILLFRTLAPRSAAGLHEQLADTVMRSKISYFASADSGFILNRFSQDMTLVSQTLPQSFFSFVYMLFHILIMFGIILAGATYSTAILPFMFIFIWFLQYFYLRTSRQMRHLDLECKTPLYTHFAETASGLRHIRAFGWEHDNFERSLRLLDVSQKPFYAMSAIQRWLSFYLDMFACTIGTTVTAFAVKFSHTTSAPALGLSFLNLVWFGLALGFFIQAWVGLETSVGALSRLREFLDHTPVESRVPTKHLPPNWPQYGSVVFKNVTARYSDDTPISLKNVSLDVAPGSKIGITGRTGSGKSSLLLTLLGFLDYSGTIEIDGVDISTIPVDDLRARISTVSQENLDFGGSIRSSLLPFRLGKTEVTRDTKEEDAEIQTVLERLNIWDAITKQGGLDAQMDKVGLSHGQLQLLSIARAILHQRETKGKLVLMDEATSHVDMKSDADAQKFFKEAFDSCTIVMIAHRLETIEDADTFVELSHGVAEIARKQLCYLEIMLAIGVETWLAHGTLLRWWWNAQTMPWDYDIDVQVSGATMKGLADNLNGTEHLCAFAEISETVDEEAGPVVATNSSHNRTYLLDINPHHTELNSGGGYNLIDGRCIDMENGMFVDITELRERASQGDPGVWSCKNGHL